MGVDRGGSGGVGAIALLLLSIAVSARAGPRLETLRFIDPNPDPSPVVGYRLYVGPDSVRATAIDIGQPAAGTAGIRSYPLLVEEGAAVYVALTAYDAAGHESARSNAILRAPRRPAFDHDADGGSDLLRIDDASGAIEILGNGSDVSPRSLSLAAPAGSSIVARGDFDGNGTSDILWQRKGSRELALWRLEAPVGPAGSAAVVVDDGAFPTPAPQLRLLASADLDGDQRDDLVFRRGAQGELHLWLASGLGSEGEEILSAPPAPWRLVGVADVDADRRGDFVWWDPSNDALRVWHMNGATILEDARLAPGVPRSARPLDLGDFDGDGTADLLVRVGTGPFVAISSLLGGPGPDWTIAMLPDPRLLIGAGHDFGGDGREDLVLVDRAARTVIALTLEGSGAETSPMGFAGASLPGDLARRLGDSDNDWNPDSCDADFDGDGRVTNADFQKLRSCYGTPAVGECEALDADADGVIGNPELELLSSLFGGPPCAGPGAR